MTPGHSSEANAEANTVAVPGNPPLATDFRSDTVTRPTAAMYERMRTAPLGDDGLDGDPTVRELETRVAHTLGKAAGLFVPSATMGNLLAVLAQAERQSQVLMESTAHMLVSERGGATFGGVFYAGIAGTAGAMNLDALEQALRSHAPLPTRLVCVETTHNNAGGAVLPLAHLHAVGEQARRHGAAVHLDGARLFNAAVALGESAQTVAQAADTVSLCLSKGLSAPAGAVLAGGAAIIAHARQLRKMLGGTQRQIGLIAAAGLEAVETMPAQLARDHAQAQSLSLALNAIRPALLRASLPQTNIVLLDLPPRGPDSAAWARYLGANGIGVRPWGEHRLRLVTHRHIEPAGVDAAARAFQAAARALLPDEAAR